MDCSLLPPMDATLPNFAEKTFANNHKNFNICKSCLPQTFPGVRYSVLLHSAASLIRICGQFK